MPRRAIYDGAACRLISSSAILRACRSNPAAGRPSGSRAQNHARDGVNKTLLFFMVDLDDFKSANDTYGHAAGDLVLQHASAALRGACRDADFVVRWGGEEFLIVARNSDRDCADLLANNCAMQCAICVSI
jgi:diguanylate cyclase (GGDEF)-like protein